MEAPARGPDRLRDLPAGYFEWRAPPALRHAVACVWAQVTPPTAGRDSLVLPDGCSDLIWERGRGAYVAGPDTGPVPTTLAAGRVVVGVRFRPSAGGPALGLPLSDLHDQRVDLADVRPGEARQLSAGLPPDLAVARALGVAATLVAAGPPDPAVTQAARLLRDPAAYTEDIAAELGLSPRQLRRRCQAAIGYGPKTLQRVLRFRRFVSRIDAVSSAPPPLPPASALAPASALPSASAFPSALAFPPAPSRPSAAAPARLDLATLAADAGYADQAHLTRECVQLSGLTPAALARLRAV